MLELEQLEHSLDILATFHGQNLDKTFIFCIPTNQERVQFAHMLQQCLEHYRTFVCYIATKKTKVYENFRKF